MITRRDFFKSLATVPIIGQFLGMTSPGVFSPAMWSQHVSDATRDSALLADMVDIRYAHIPEVGQVVITSQQYMAVLPDEMHQVANTTTHLFSSSNATQRDPIV